MNSSKEDEERTPTASSWMFPVEPEVEIEESETYLELTESEDDQMEECLSEPEEENSTNAVRELESELVDKMCEICGNFFKTFELVNPEARKPLLSTCETCSYYISPRVSLYSTSSMDEFPCDECNRVFVRKDKLLRHKAAHSKSKEFSCDMCDKSYKTNDTLSEHIKHAHLKSEEEFRDKCITCGTNKNIITINVGENEAEFVKLCEACNLSRQEQMAQLNQNGSDGFSCDLCMKYFSRKDHVARHRLTHLNVKPFECSMCKKSFSRSDRLQRHMRIHPGAKAFSCKICSKAFDDRVKFKTHLSTHTKKSKLIVKVDDLQRQQASLEGNRPCVCEVCGKTFGLTSALLAHQKLHSDASLFKCDTCEQKFKTKDNFNRHLLVHSTAKVYSCHICEKIFKRKDKLKTHHLVHIDIKPYSCDICSKAFKRKDKLDRHVQVVHCEVFLSEEDPDSSEIVC